MVTEQISPDFKQIASEHTTVAKIAGGFIFTEGPVWHGSEGTLVWTDIIGDTIWKWVPGELTSPIFSPSGHANGMTYDHQGRLIIAGWSNRTVWRLEPDGSTTVLASHYDGKKLNTPNDIVVKSDGSIYFTDPTNGCYLVGHQDNDIQKYLEFEGVFRLDPKDSSLTLLIDDMEVPNGICFSPDETLLYVNDTRRRHIRVYDVNADGGISNGRIFIEMSGSDLGNPDGMKVDSVGNVYCTGPGGIWVMNPAGDLLGRIRIPEQASNFAWGEADYRTLFVTSRTSVYRVKLGIAGIPVFPLA
ncbi:MAG: SMP-30/gluconolactonase/LRE family protein [Dehalococcoidia bacterium]